MENNRRSIVLMGSARIEGNTSRAVEEFCKTAQSDVEVVNMARLSIMPFEYGRHDDRDDFRSVIREMLKSQDIVFATPVYWYSMSGYLKTFFDRMTELITDPRGRASGRGLAGRHMWVLATGTGAELPPGFAKPFELTAAYLDMVWQEAFYCRSPDGESLDSVGMAGARLLAEAVDSRV